MADTKISALTAETALAATDLVPLAISPFGATDNRKITIANFFTAVPGAISATGNLVSTGGGLRVAATDSIQFNQGGNAFGGIGPSADGRFQLFSDGFTAHINFGPDGANDVAALRRGTNAQQLNNYLTYTDASNYARMAWYTSGSTGTIAWQDAGTGAASRNLRLQSHSAGTHYFEVDAGGNAYATTAIGTTNEFFMQGQSNGVVTLYNWDSNDFGRLQFGGTSSSFPALRRDGASLTVVTADNGGYADFLCGNLQAASHLRVDGYLRFGGGIVTETNSTHTLATSTNFLICNRAGDVTVTLGAASSYAGRPVWIKTIQAQTVTSASSNVVPLGDSAAGTSILPATDGAWCVLVSDGTNWIKMAGSEV